MKKLLIIAALITGTLTTTAQDKCEYRLQSKDGSVFRGVDLPCGYKVGDKTKEGHTIMQVLPTYCQGITLKGQHCTRKAQDGVLYCRQHEPTAVRCAGKRKDGQPCRSLPSKGSAFCHNHKG